MKKQLLLLAALLSMGLAEAMKHQAFDPKTHPRDAHGRFTKPGQHPKRGYARGHRRGGRPMMTLDEKLARNARGIARTEAAIAALDKAGDTKFAEEFREQLKNKQAYRVHLEGKKAAGKKTYARGSKKGWLETLGLGGLGYGLGKHEEAKAKAPKEAPKRHPRKVLTEDEKKARKEAREKRMAERKHRRAVRKAEVKKTIAEA